MRGERGREEEGDDEECDESRDLFWRVSVTRRERTHLAQADTCFEDHDADPGLLESLDTGDGGSDERSSALVALFVMTDD